MGGEHRCSVCNATFTRPQHVARHMRSHTGDRPYKCRYCGDQFARSDLLSRHVNKCHSNEKQNTSCQKKKPNAVLRATTSKQACDQCVQSALPCDGANPCAKCIQHKSRCTFVQFHRQTAPTGPGHPPPPPVNKDSQSRDGRQPLISSNTFYFPAIHPAPVDHPHVDYPSRYRANAAQLTHHSWPASYQIHATSTDLAPSPVSSLDSFLRRRHSVEYNSGSETSLSDHASSVASSRSSSAHIPLLDDHIPFPSHHDNFNQSLHIPHAHPPAIRTIDLHSTRSRNSPSPLSAVPPPVPLQHSHSLPQLHPPTTSSHAQQNAPAFSSAFGLLSLDDPTGALMLAAANNSTSDPGMSGISLPTITTTAQVPPPTNPNSCPSFFSQAAIANMEAVAADPDATPVPIAHSSNNANRSNGNRNRNNLATKVDSSGVDKGREGGASGDEIMMEYIRTTPLGSLSGVGGALPGPGPGPPPATSHDIAQDLHCHGQITASATSAACGLGTGSGPGPPPPALAPALVSAYPHTVSYPLQVQTIDINQQSLAMNHGVPAHVGVYPPTETEGSTTEITEHQTKKEKEDDLRSYEAAVLARKAPTNLSLGVNPMSNRRRGGCAKVPHGDTSPDMAGLAQPPQAVRNMEVEIKMENGELLTVPLHATVPVPVSTLSNSAPTMTSASSLANAFGTASGGDTTMTTAADLPAAARPSFKRLPSQTLEPPGTAKRAQWAYDSHHGEAETAGESQPQQRLTLAERRRKMSLSMPTMSNGGGGGTKADVTAGAPAHLAPTAAPPAADFEMNLGSTLW